MRGNRQYKDSVFCDYMAEGPKLVDLYNAIYGTSYPPDTPVEINTLEGILYMDRVNDISFTLDNRFVVLIEQQSTVNHNMPLRMLLYVARLYEKILSNDNLYREGRIPLFTPQFIVLYNGSREQTEYRQERLSDAFTEPLEYPPLELTVQMFNISRTGEQVPRLLQRCKSLNAYSMLIGLIETHRANGYTVDESIRLALQVCIEQNIMKEYLEKNGAEVQNMLLTEWNWNDAFRVRGEEKFAAGKAEGEQKARIGLIRNLMETMGWTEDAAMDALKIPEDEREACRVLLNE